MAFGLCGLGISSGYLGSSTLELISFFREVRDKRRNHIGEGTRWKFVEHAVLSTRDFLFWCNIPLTSETIYNGETVQYVDSSMRAIVKGQKV